MTKALSLCIPTTTPPTGACDEIVTVPIVLTPPTEFVGLIVKVVRVGGFSVIVALAEEDSVVAVIVAKTRVATDWVETVKVVLDAPSGTVMLPRTEATETLLERSTLSPPDGAGPFSVNVPVELAPPTNEVGLNSSPLTPNGFTVRLALFDVVPCVAVTLAEICFVTRIVVIEKVAVDAPDWTVTTFGTCTTDWLLLSVIFIPEEGALPVKDTVPVSVLPPPMLEG